MDSRPWSHSFISSFLLLDIDCVLTLSIASETSCLQTLWSHVIVSQMSMYIPADFIALADSCILPFGSSNRSLSFLQFTIQDILQLTVLHLMDVPKPIQSLMPQWSEHRGYANHVEDIIVWDFVLQWNTKNFVKALHGIDV